MFSVLLVFIRGQYSFRFPFWQPRSRHVRNFDNQFGVLVKNGRRFMREWLRETHGPGFELLRHFLLRFFDSDLITVPDHWVTTAIGAFSVVLPWFPLFAQPLRHKYAYFSGLPFPGPYRQAVRADELWLLTLMMSAIALLTAIKWQSLFPGLGDYRALGGLPLKARQIFLAKLLALLLVATAAA